jgi:hypothetical protein
MSWRASPEPGSFKIREQETLKLWKREFFLHYLGILAQYLVA